MKPASQASGSQVWNPTCHHSVTQFLTGTLAERRNWLQVSQAAIAELVREADLLGSLRHPNVVWVYGMVLPEPGMEDQDDVDAGDVEVAAAAAHHHRNQGGVPGTVRPPAIVTEFMSQGSLKGALQRKADIVQGALMRVLIAMDAAKVRHSRKQPQQFCGSTSRLTMTGGILDSQPIPHAP